MNKNLKPNERELIKLATFFKKQSRKLMDEGKLGEEHKSVERAVETFIEHISQHADARASILEQREYLKNLVKDDAECPTCHKRDMLKYTGVEKSEKGWKSNRYKCRRCNIAFTWNRPNNPWDMIDYLEDVLAVLRLKQQALTGATAQQESQQQSIDNLQKRLNELKPVIEAHDRDFAAMEQREAEMEKLVHEFRNSLLIERIKMDTWENKMRP